MKRSWLRYGFLTAVAAIPVLGVPNLARHAELAWLLAGRPVIERGQIASDENANFLARAGRPTMRSEFAAAAAAGDESPSAIANIWAWAFAEAAHLPPEARVYLNVPNMALYYYASFFWFPRRVDVNPSPVLVSGEGTLRRGALHFSPSERGRLRERGYTHVIDQTPRGSRIFPLGPVDGTR